MRLLLSVALFAAVGAFAAERPRPTPGDWLFVGTLPSYLRMETRQLATRDADAAKAAVGAWMDAHHGKEAEAGDDQPDFGDVRWVIRADQLPGLDAALAKLGRLTPGPAFAPQTLDAEAMARVDAGNGAAPAWLPMADARALAAKRDGLRADLDRISGLASGYPSVVRLGEAYAASLDAVLAAQRRYDAAIAVDVSFAELGTDARQFASGGGRVDPHGPNASGTVVSEHGANRVSGGETAVPASGADSDAPDGAVKDINVGGRRMVVLLPYRERPGAFRVPPGGDAPADGDDYLAWDAVAPASLEDEAELRVVVEAGDAAAERGKLDESLRRIGAGPAGFAARGPAERFVRFGPKFYAAQRPAGYWIARAGLERFHKLLAAKERLKAWETVEPRGPSKRVRDEAVVWERGLSEELSSDDEHLASYPFLKALVVDQLRRLRDLGERSKRSEDAALVSVQVMSPRAASAFPAAPAAAPGAVGGPPAGLGTAPGPAPGRVSGMTATPGPAPGLAPAPGPAPGAALKPLSPAKQPPP